MANKPENIQAYQAHELQSQFLTGSGFSYSTWWFFIYPAECVAPRLWPITLKIKGQPFLDLFRGPELKGQTHGFVAGNLITMAGMIR